MMHAKITTLRTLAFLAFGFGALTACSGKDEPDEPVNEQAASGDANAEEGSATAAEKDGEQAAKDGDGAPESSSTDTAAAEPEPAPPPPKAEAAPSATAAAMASPAAAPMAAAPGAPGNGQRVVRYINVPQATLYTSASETGAAAGTIEQGERLMIVEENGWGRVSDQMFVKLDKLSSRAVPRIWTKAQWQAPSH